MAETTTARGGGRRVGRWEADSGEIVEVIDVVDGAPADEVAAIQSVFRRHFPQYLHTLEDIAIDASLPGRREGVVVHQWLILVNDEPSGVVLFESNLVRRCGVAQFVSIDEHCRSMTVNENPLAKILYWLALPQILKDGGPAMLGVGFELPLGRRPRSVQLKIDYAEPVGGRRWRVNGGIDDIRWHPMSLEWAPMNWDPVWLHWTPDLTLRPVVESPGIGHDVTCRFVAAYLIDHYQLLRDHPLVQRLAGAQADLDVFVDRWPLNL